MSIKFDPNVKMITDKISRMDREQQKETFLNACKNFMNFDNKADALLHIRFLSKEVTHEVSNEGFLMISRAVSAQ